MCNSLRASCILKCSFVLELNTCCLGLKIEDTGVDMPKSRKFWVVNANGAPLMQTVRVTQTLRRKDEGSIPEGCKTLMGLDESGRTVQRRTKKDEVQCTRVVTKKRVLEVDANNPSSAARLAFQSMLRTTQCRLHLLNNVLKRRDGIGSVLSQYDGLSDPKQEMVEAHIDRVNEDLMRKEKTPLDVENLKRTFVTALNNPFEKVRGKIEEWVRNGKIVTSGFTPDQLHKIFTHIMLNTVLVVRIVAVDDLKDEKCRGRGNSQRIHEYVVGYVLNTKPYPQAIKRNITHESQLFKIAPHTVRQLANACRKRDVLEVLLNRNEEEFKTSLQGLAIANTSSAKVELARSVLEKVLKDNSRVSQAIWKARRPKRHELDAFEAYVKKLVQEALKERIREFQKNAIGSE